MPLTLLTGAIGSAIATALADAGHELILVARDPTKAATLAERIALSTHIRPRTEITDLARPTSITTLAGLTAIIEPLLIGVLGVVIGGIVICMFLPIMKLATIVKI